MRAEAWCAAAAAAACVGAGAASGQVVFSDDFDAASGAGWNVNASSADTSVTFGFDYSTVGVPPSPNGGGTTLGLRLAANMTFPTGAEAVTLSPAGQSFGGSYELRFDVWINFNGPVPQGGTGSTEFFTCGVGYDDASVNGSSSGSGGWFATSGEGGASRDYRGYKGAVEQFAESGQFLAGTSSVGGGAHNASDSYYNGFGSVSVDATAPDQVALFPIQSGTTFGGTLGMAWHEVSVVVSGTTAVWSVDGLPIAELDTTVGSAFPLTGNISIGYMDPFSSVSDNADLSFAIIDNLRVCSPLCPEVMGACCAPDGLCSVVTAAACAGLNGTYGGNGTDCGDVTCVATQGACCFANGDCFDAVDEGQCAASRGMFQGVGTSCAAGCVDLVDGPDVVGADVSGIANWGSVGGTHAYSLGMFTCNVGDQDLRWGNDWNGSPVMVMNAYRLHEGRIEQVGMSWVKHACCVTITRDGCGICNGVNGQLLGVGCRDSYSATYNGRQDRMGPRSRINAWTGTIPVWPNDTGNAIHKRLQIREGDLLQQTQGAQYFVEGVYVGSDDAPSGNWENNSSYRPVRVDPGTFELSLVDRTYEHVPAILAWRDHGGGLGVSDPDVTIVIADVPGEGRFYAGAKVSENGDGTWRYEYALFNQNSDRSGGSLSVPAASDVTVTNIGFHDVDYHSGELYDNADWSRSRLADAVRWTSPQTFAQNPNSNALRWGTMYNFRFDADAPPGAGAVSLGLFKPGSPGSIDIALPVPASAECPCEFDGAGGVDVFDLLAYLDVWFAGDGAADFDGVPGVDVFDLLAFLDCWFPASAGGACP